MVGSLRTLLDGVVDYAGLFPPAGLSMEEAVARYAEHRKGDESWMLSHFICPVARLGEFETEARDLFWETPWTLSLLGKGEDDPWEWIDEITREIHEVAAFEERHEGRVAARALEVPFPGKLLADPDPVEVRPWIEELNQIFGSRNTSIDQVFLEIGFPDDWSDVLPRLFETLGGASASTSCVSVGVKIRTGGLTPEAIPTCKQVASFLLTAHENRLPAKATAGLHHPYRHFSESVGSLMHGFLNVFAGAALVHAEEIDRDRLIALLDDQEARHFTYNDEGMAWTAYACPVDRIRSARESLLVTFGSCSLSEPVEDLTTAGLW
jgi:hypothetical protein